MPEGLSCLSQAQSSAYSASTLFRWFRAFSGPTCRRTLLSALSVSTCSEKRIQLCRFGIPPPECPLRDQSKPSRQLKVGPDLDPKLKVVQIMTILRNQTVELRRPANDFRFGYYDVYNPPFCRHS